MLRENSFTHNVGTGGDRSCLVRCFARGKEDVVIFGSPNFVALEINVYASLEECARERNLSVNGPESPNFQGMLAGEYHGGGPAAARPKCPGAAG